MDNQIKFESVLVLLLRLGTFLCFAGWTWGHLYWEGPYGVLLWQEDTHALANWLGLTWEEFVGTGANDGFVQRWITRIGWWYLVCAVVAWTVRRTSRFQWAILAGGSVLLAILAYANYVNSQRQLPMFIEHGGQILMPVLLVLALALGVRDRVTVGVAMAAFIMTFAGHGFYALNLWPTPAGFHAMTTVILKLEYPTTVALLHTVGVLDLIACVGIFVPRLRVPAAIYGVVWGFLTALARPVAGMSLTLNFWGADQFLHEAVLRAPHFVIPLFLLLIWRQQAPADTGNSPATAVAADASAATPPSGAPHVLPDKPAFNR